MSDRHPKRKWFGATAGAYAHERGTYAAHRDRPGTPAMMDSPVVKSFLTPAQQVEREAVAILADRVLTPWQRRERYPGGWLKAPYVRVPAGMARVVGR